MTESTKQGRIARSIQGVLVYLNAFLLLDLMREVFVGRIIVAVIIALTITIAAMMYLDEYVA